MRVESFKKEKNSSMKLSAQRKMLSKKAAIRKITITVLVIGILVFAFLVRRNTFWLPHWQGDQSHYLSLAMKLDNFGLDGYNLRGVKIKFIKFEPTGTLRLAYVLPLADPRQKGDILRGLEMFGIDYYDMPLYYKAPAFSYALFLSHKVFAKAQQLIASRGQMLKIMCIVCIRRYFYRHNYMR